MRVSASQRARAAVGYYITSNNNAKTLIESWNGIASVVPSPNVGAGISSGCRASPQLLHRRGRADNTLVESWNGIALVIAEPKLRGVSALLGVSCLSRARARPLASTSPPAASTGPSSSLGRHQLVHRADPRQCGGDLDSVSCVSRARAPVDSLLPVESWDSTAWSAVTTPRPRDMETTSLWRLLRHRQRLHGRGLILQWRVGPRPDRVLERHRMVHRAEPGQKARDPPVRRVLCFDHLLHGRRRIQQPSKRSRVWAHPHRVLERQHVVDRAEPQCCRRQRQRA